MVVTTLSCIVMNTRFQCLLKITLSNNSMKVGTVNVFFLGNYRIIIMVFMPFCERKIMLKKLLAIEEI